MEKPVDLKASWNGFEGRRVSWRAAETVDSRGQIDLGPIYSTDDDRAAYGWAVFESPAERKAEMVVGSDDTLTVWLNGKKVYEFADRRGFEHEQGRVDVPLSRGQNRVLVRCGNRGGGWQFAVAVTRTGRARVSESPRRREASTPILSRACIKRAGECVSGPEPVQRCEGPGVHQVPFGRQGGRHGRARSFRAWEQSIRVMS